jgi:ABC-type Fe3+-hydroxamate transport system substrate-binding protein
MNTRRFTDMMGRQVQVPFPPQRVVSLVPSQTELLFDLGLADRVVGITKFCIHPRQWFQTKTRVGGTKNVHLDSVRLLQPDLILANKEENEKAQIEALAKEFPLWISDIQDLPTALNMIHRVGELCDVATPAAALNQNIRDGFSQLTQSSKPLKVAYFIWKDPWMCAGGDTFISSMIEAMGWQNVLAHSTRYPEVEPATLDADVFLLSSEPFPFKDKHIAQLQALQPKAKILLVDGEMFSWYGSRMLHAIPYMANLMAQQAY